jgi:hypothetical protein
MKILVIVLGCIAVFLAALIAIRKSKSPLQKACSICEGESKFGYSEHAEEDPEKIKPLCLNCLVSQLEKDYTAFSGRAVVVEPAQGPPVYVFQATNEWQQSDKDTKVAEDVLALLAKMHAKCHDCGQKAKYVWVESSGLNGENFGESLDKGLTETVLRHNPAPISLCAKCCVRHIAKDLEAKHLSYVEVSAPKGAGEGFVIPMGY